jgi:hypothetical protein
MWVLGVTGLLCLAGVLYYWGQISETRRLTEEHGPELQETFEEFAAAVVIANETGDTARLNDVATGYELRHHTETAGADSAVRQAEWWKVEVIRVTVHECSEDTAKALVEYKVVGEISDDDYRNVWIVYYGRADGKWKVSNLEPYFSSDRG